MKTLITTAVAATVLVSQSYGNDLFDYWYQNVVPRYGMNIYDIHPDIIDKDSAVLLEPLTSNDGTRIKMSAHQGSFEIICFYGCLHDKYLYEAGNIPLCYDCRKNSNCKYWPFANACKECPALDGANAAAVRLPQDAPKYNDIRDCAIPAGTTVTDDSGVYTLTADCHYE